MGEQGLLIDDDQNGEFMKGSSRGSRGRNEHEGTVHIVQ